MQSSPKRVPLSTTLIVLGLFFTIYLTVYSGDFLSNDERALFASANGLAMRGSPTANPFFWQPKGVVRLNTEGDIIANFEPGQVILSAPLMFLARFLPKVGMVHAAFLFNALVTAGTVVVLVHYLSALGQSLPVSVTTAALFGLASPALPYSQTFFREPLSGLLLLAGAYFMLRLGQRSQVSDAVLCGLTLGTAFATKQANVLALIALLPFGLIYLGQASRDWRGRVRLALAVAIPGLLVIVAALGYQYAYGRQAIQNNALADPAVASSAIDAFLGFLFSPGKSLFVYAPVLIAAFVALPLSLRRYRRETILAMAVFAAFVVGYSAMKPVLWWGGLNWGPRFLVPVVPFLFVPIASVVAWAMNHRRTWRTLLFGFLVALSVAVQLIGVSVSTHAYSASITQMRPDGMWTLALYNPLYSQPLHSLVLLKPQNLSFAWIHRVGDSVHVDWLVLGAAAAVLSAFVLTLWYSRRRRLPSWLGLVLLVAVLALTGFMLVRRYEDPRFPGGDDYRALLQDLGRQASVDEVLVLTNKSYGDLFLNYNKARLDWYGLNKAAEQLSPEVESLLRRLIERTDRLWLVTDQTPELGLPHPEEDWLTARLYLLQDTRYSDYSRLLLYSTEDLPDPKRPAMYLDLSLGEEIGLIGYDLPDRVLGRGDALRLSLLWVAREKLGQDLTVFVQLIDSGGQVVWQADRYPVNGQRPTSGWEPGEQIRDQYGWIIPEELPAGSYRLIAGLYELESMSRWPVSDSDGRGLGDFVELGTVVVEPSE